MSSFSRCLRTAAVAVCLLLAHDEIWATGPGYQTDYEISQYPIVVVATWNKAAVTSHNLIEGNVCKEQEAFTELNVLRVLKGDLKVGRQSVMFGWGIGWNADGKELATWTSTRIPGDVDDLTQPNLWFLDRKRSWDAKDTSDYLHIPHYRAIQPVGLEPYFRALLETDRDSRVPRLLENDDALIVHRALRYICGEIWPWPYEPAEWDDLGYFHPQKRERLLTDSAAAVARVFNGPHEELRSLAVAVYAELAKDAARARLRELLNDKNPSVRGVAIGLLLREKDAAILGQAVDAVVGVEDGQIACKIIAALASWRERRGVPILINFLENDHYAYRYGDDVGIPALKARTALYALTECWFPYRVSSALDAWAQVESIADDQLRQQRLAELLQEPEFPVVAELVGGPHVAPAATTQTSQPAGTERRVSALPSTMEPSDRAGTVRLRNISVHPILISKVPTSVEQEWRSGGRSYASGPRPFELTDSDYIELAPGQTLEFEISVNGRFLRAERSGRVLKLHYSRFPSARSERCWVGVLPVQFGPLWDGTGEAGPGRPRKPMKSTCGCNLERPRQARYSAEVVGYWLLATFRGL